MKQSVKTSVLLVILILGVCIAGYPSFANWWNQTHQTQAILSYQDKISHTDTVTRNKLIKDAEEYNEWLGSRGLLWNLTAKEEEYYRKQLVLETDGVIGYINIPKIDVNLPIYHGVEEKHLQTSIGHLPSTSLPVGGESSHSVLSGHRGLPSARLFSDLDKLKIGDTWTVQVLGVTYTYEVDQIRTVLPDDVSQIQIEEGKDYQTLLTCTPYGVNTHRLLVRGHRVSNKNGNAVIVADAMLIEPVKSAMVLTVVILGLISVWLVIDTFKRKKEV